MQLGTPPAAGHAPERPGAYGVIVDDAGRVAIVDVRGAVHLPGGGIEPGEDALAALHREVFEETGLAVQVVRELGVASEYVTIRGTVWNKVGRYFLCRPLGRSAEGEADHVLRWWPAAEVVASLEQDAHREMVRRATA